ncbi:unnamed protein product [Adineta steineri]|uniref:Coiled-coil-helix-coiled-coil-helix domain-containing protein 7 n=1 Tax=Adineta steineri TaxID=433720 RepID=A0A815APU2_9BILA|nr:unnamed protein product [Adineta steineri]CAF1298013.1 unnamed protein product [Adineta steineri]CAF1548621.1 unnamed protein product [Adineta steineri]CAF1574581.1 unnamed protein product [Adineta steineri]
MSSSTINTNNDDVEENITYKPGTFRYQDLPPDKRKKLFEDRQRELNPCLKESEIATSCITMHGDDHHKCDMEVENYKTCKRFWTAVRSFATTNHLLKNDGFPPLDQRPIWKKQLQSWVETKKLTIPEEIKPLV